MDNINYLDYLAARQQLLAQSFLLGQQNFLDAQNRLNIFDQSIPPVRDMPVTPISPTTFPPPTGSRLSGIIDTSQVTIPKTDAFWFDSDAFYADLTSEVIGQKQALRCLTDLINIQTSKPKPQRPLTVLLAGSTGVGKTLTGEQTAKGLSKHTNHDWGYIRIDLNQLTEKHDVSMLTGTSAGYVGYDDKLLFEPLLSNKRQVILLDELEKGHPIALQTIMNAMSNGRFEARKFIDGQREFDFRQAIMIFTSNIPLSVKNPDDMTQAEITRECRKQLTKPGEGGPSMPPEIAARFSEILLYRDLSDEDKVEILGLTIIRTVEQHNLNVRKIDPDFLQDVVDRLSVERGAREPAHEIDKMLGKPIKAFKEGHEGVKDIALSGTCEQVIVEPYTQLP